MKAGKISSRAVLYPAAAVGLVLLSQQSFAAAPKPGTFDSWSVNSCPVTIGACPTGYTCGTAVTGDGFYQRQITDPITGNSYFETMLADSGTITIQPIVIPDPVVAPTPPTRNDFPNDAEFNEESLSSLDSASQVIYHDLTEVTMTTASSTTTVDCNQVTTYSPAINLILGPTSPLKIPEGYGVVYRVYTSNGWADFAIDNNNYFVSAKKQNDGSCPLSGSEQYQAGLKTDAECIQLTIEDGGPNDGDGIANHTVKFTGGPLLRAIPPAPAAVGTPGPAVKNSDGNSAAATDGGGGVWPWWLSLAAAGMLFGHNRRQRRAD